LSGISPFELIDTRIRIELRNGKAVLSRWHLLGHDERAILIVHAGGKTGVLALLVARFGYQNDFEHALWAEFDRLPVSTDPALHFDQVLPRAAGEQTTREQR
jgi:hypothetical protein